MMKLKLLFSFILLISLFSCNQKAAEKFEISADQNESQQHLLTESNDSIDIRFLLFLPENYETKENWPLMLFLHGAGERGDDLEKVAVHGPPKLARQGKLQDFIIIAPQCPKGDYWDSHKQQTNLINLLRQAKNDLKVDPNRVYLTGLSMGGFGTWELAANLHDEVAAAVPVCGGGNVWNSRVLKDVPIWAFHGALDDVVPPKLSEEMVEAIHQRGGNVQLTIFPDANHNSWDPAYDTEELYEWLLQQNLKSR